MFEYGSETGLEYLYELRRIGIKVNSIICVGDQYSEKRSQLLLSRTEGHFKRKSFVNFLDDSTIPVYIINDVNSLSCENILNYLKPDLVVFEGSFIIRNKIYQIPKLGMLNVHLAILPYHRGCSCMEWSIINNYPVGVTCHYIEKNVDTGKIINRISLKYNSLDTYGIMRSKLLYLAAYSLGQAVENILIKDSQKKEAYENIKGQWFSPMKDNKIINKMKKKIINGDYKPIKIKDNIPIEILDVDLKTGFIIT